MANCSKWGSSGSKETVQCFYCKTETRLDNLERHSNVRHPGRPVKHKIIVSSNQRTLFQMFDKKIDDRENKAESESQELEKNTELDEITEMDDIEGDANNAINKTISTEKECLDSEDFVSKKRNRCAESEPIPEKAVKKHFCSQSGENTGDASMIVELIKESNDRIEKKLDALEQKIIETINNSYRNDPVNTCQSKVNQTEKNDEIFLRDLASCKDLSFGYTSNILL